VFNEGTLASARTREHRNREHKGPPHRVHTNTRTREHTTSDALRTREHANTTRTAFKAANFREHAITARTQRSTNTRTREHGPNTAFTRTQVTVQTNTAFKRTQGWRSHEHCVHTNTNTAPLPSQSRRQA